MIPFPPIQILNLFVITRITYTIFRNALYMPYGQYYGLKLDDRAKNIKWSFCNNNLQQQIATTIAMQVAPLFRAKMCRKCTITAILQYLTYKNHHAHNKFFPRLFCKPMWTTKIGMMRRTHNVTINQKLRITFHIFLFHTEKVFLLVSFHFFEI